MTIDLWRRRYARVRSLPRLIANQDAQLAELLRRLGEQETRTAEMLGRLERIDASVRPGQPTSGWTVGPARAYAGQDRAWVRTPWGGKLLVDTTDLLIAPYLLLDGVWEPEVTQFLRATLKPGMTFVDVGANLGYFTILAALAVGSGGRVVAFEAQPATHELLVKNAIVNWVGSFTTVEGLAVYDRSCTLDFHIRKRYPGNSSIVPVTEQTLHDHLDQTEKIRVDAVSLDDYFAARDKRVDVLKVDVEGAEVRAFRGMAALLGANPAITVMCEWSQSQIKAAGDDPAELVDEFERHGLGMSRIEPVLRPITRAEVLGVEYCNLALRRG